jgi:RIO-like serine/threonine protein kinase
MGMGQQMAAVEATREALSHSELRHLGVLLEQEAVGEWVPQEKIASHDRARRRDRRKNLAALRDRNLDTLQKSFQMALF